MKRFIILYDANCPFCVSCKDWLEAQAQYIVLKFIPKDSDTARVYYEDLMNDADSDQLILVASEGRVYVDDAALIMSLYALREYRELSAALSKPSMRPMTKQIFKMVSENRDKLSNFV